MARTFRRIQPDSSWDRIVVTKPKDSGHYVLDIWCVNRLIETITVLGPLSNLLQELSAMGCNISGYRQYLPPTHQDI